MTTTLLVLLDGEVAGTLHRTPSGLTFDYDPAYQADPTSTPLSLSMPVAAGPFNSPQVTPWLWGLLPDNAEVLGRWARELQVSASSPFSLLGSSIGEDCAGAVQFVRPERLDEVQDRRATVDWLTEDEIASTLAALRGDPSAWLGPGFEGRFSLAGAQAKTALFHDGRRWGRPRGATATTHILKPAITGLDGHDLDEHLCQDAARRAGLRAARTTVRRFGDESALVVTRYDRVVSGERVDRVHQEDLCQALGVAPGRKYQADGGPGVRQIADVLRNEIRPVPAGDEAVVAFRDGLAWNWIIGGTDAHAKNFSVLLSGRQVRLAPLYDVASILAYPHVDQLKLKSAMKLGGEYRYKAHRRATWVKVARELGLDAEQTVARVAELVELAPQALADAAGEPDVQALDSPLPARLVDAVADRATTCARQLDERD